MDNTCFHKSEKTKSIIEGAGCILYVLFPTPITQFYIIEQSPSPEISAQAIIAPDKPS